MYVFKCVCMCVCMDDDVCVGDTTTTTTTTATMHFRPSRRMFSAASSYRWGVHTSVEFVSRSVFGKCMSYMQEFRLQCSTLVTRVSCGVFEPLFAECNLCLRYGPVRSAVGKCVYLQDFICDVVYACIHAYTHTYVHTNMHTHKHTYTHIHTRSKSELLLRRVQIIFLGSRSPGIELSYIIIIHTFIHIHAYIIHTYIQT